MTKEEKIVAFMKEDAYKPLKAEELIAVLDVPKSDIGEFVNIMDNLEEEGKIIKTRKNKYGAPEKMGLVVGQYSGNDRGFGFVIPDDSEMADVFISPENTNGAMNKDKVIARFTRAIIEGKRAEGEIIRILKRVNNAIIGVFETSKHFAFVVPDDRKIYNDVFVPKEEFNGAQNGDKVVVEIIRWPEQGRNPEGRITEVLGGSDDPETHITSILRKFKLNEEFPHKVNKYLEKVPNEVNLDEIAERKDLRNLPMVTIDGADARDLDDAVSLEVLQNNNYRLGVHIADVSHYVTEKSPLDKEAFKRGTSVYITDRVIPMLPPKLSNGICSLNPQVDRLALTVFMEIDKQGKVTNHEILESVIRTKERMTYEDVTEILENDNKELKKRYEDLVDRFENMKELALILKKKRMERGSIDFDFPEPKIILDDTGKPIEIKKYETTISNKIIEEFMLICNETIAEHMFWLNSPFVYRVHEEPDSEKIKDFNNLIYNFGYYIKGLSKVHPRALQQILEKIKGKKEEKIVSTIMLRSLMKAKYSHENLGHFGLAAKYYCHFTAPIRRYPDLIIHRIIKERLKGEIKPERLKFLNNFVVEAAKQSSLKEIDAQEAEREDEDLRMTQYMSDKVGEEFNAIISGVTSFGMFVELDNTIEGLITMSNLEDDYYMYDDKHFCLIGEHTGKVYRIGDEVKVRLVRADIITRQIDFVLA
jgi:ribonuclease R